MASASVDYIVKAPEKHLRAAVRALCSSDEKVCNQLAKYIRFIEARSPVSREEKARRTANDPVKVSAPMPQIPGEIYSCLQCKVKYYAVLNKPGVCCYQPGELEINKSASFWVGWCQEGPWDTPENKKDYPEGFIFTCCKRERDHPGCKEDKHHRDMSVPAAATAQSATKPPTNGKPVNDTKPKAQNEPKIQKESNSKRKRQEENGISYFRVCERCQSTFFEKENIKGMCQWHPEELEVDDESHVWFDWDPRCHGPRDTEYNRREYPNGFLWVCCEGSGPEPGCKIGKHRAKDSKRGRYESDSESDPEEEEEEGSQDYEDHYDEE